MLETGNPGSLGTGPASFQRISLPNRDDIPRLSNALQDRRSSDHLLRAGLWTFENRLSHYPGSRARSDPATRAAIPGPERNAGDFTQQTDRCFGIAVLQPPSALNEPVPRAGKPPFAFRLMPSLTDMAFLMP